MTQQLSFEDLAFQALPPETPPAPEPPRATERPRTAESPPPPAVELGAELEAALVRALMEAYQHVNHGHFRGKLRPAAIALSGVSGRLGRWVSDTRTIEVARALVLEQPWGVVLEVLKHEMAHQYVYEVLGITAETAHGPAFRDVCGKLGIDATAAGMPQAGAPSEAEERILERIARLLALAESANVHEAEAAMSAAQRLMLKHNLDVAQARAARSYGFRHLGKPSGRVDEAARIVSGILGKHFFVEAIWVPVYLPLEGKRASVLEICGTPSNLEMAAYVHDFLHHTAEHLWLAHKETQGVYGNRDRRTFISGVMLGFLEKLNTERKVSKEKGLVWVGDADLQAFYRTRHPHVQHVRHAGNRRTEAHAHGRAAGRQIVLHKPMTGDAGSRGRLLGPKKG